MLDYLFKYPVISVNDAADVLNVSYPTANNTIATMVRLGILREITGRGRNRVFCYYHYLHLMDKGIEAAAPLQNETIEPEGTIPIRIADEAESSPVEASGTSP